jgi:putative ABC transport system permease protein
MFLYYVDMGWRSIRKTPVLSLLMVLAISIGIGITTTSLNIFKVMSHNPAGERNEVLRVVNLWSQGPDTWEKLNANITYQDAVNLRNGNLPSRQAAAFRTGLAVQGEDSKIEPVLMEVRVTDSDFFGLFDVPFVYGSPWLKSVDQQGGYQVVIKQSLSKKLFGTSNSVGKVIYLNRKPYQVVGVIEDWNPMPKYYDPINSAFENAESIYIPFSLTPIEEFSVWGNTNGWKFEPMITYGHRLVSEKTWVQYWVELADAKAVEDYRVWVRSYIQQQQALGRFTDHDNADVQLTTVARWLDMNHVVEKDNKLLVALSVLFLCVCLVNILGLLLTKFLKRAPEIGVRRAIGASRVQIFSQYMVEVSIIGLLGGIMGFAWAWLLLKTLTAKFFMASALTQLDVSMWFITPSIAIGAALLAGCYPAWVVCRTQPSVYLKSQ